MPTAFIRETVGKWAEYDFDAVVDTIYQMAGNPDLSGAEEFVKTVRVEAQDIQSELISLLSTELQTYNDPYLVRLQEKIENYKFHNYSDFVKRFLPSGQIITRDSVAMGQGLKVAPHFVVIAKVTMIRHYFSVCKEFAKMAKQATSHISRREQNQGKQSLVSPHSPENDVELDRELREAQIAIIKRQLIDQMKNLHKLLEEVSTYGNRTSAPLKLQNDVEKLEDHIIELKEELSELEANS